MSAGTPASDDVLRRYAEVSVSTTAEVAEPAALRVDVALTAPSGRTSFARAFWDGDQTWRARFVPDEVGRWFYAWTSSPRVEGFDGRTGTIEWTGSSGTTETQRHGSVRVAGSHFAHSDGTPFLWIADTAWNIALCGSEDEWRRYLELRATQGFTVIQIITTQWLGAPEGDADGNLFFTGSPPVVNPTAARRIDRFIELANQYGFLVAPVMLWAAEWGHPAKMAVNPGVQLGVKEAAQVARYMLARWGALDVAWILGGDGVYHDPDVARRWVDIGSAVFGSGVGAPVTMHPAGMTWLGPGLADQPWLTFLGFQSGHWADKDSLEWIAHGPPAKVEGARPVVNLEPCYEGMRGIVSGLPLQPADLRRATWVSLLSTPLAGISYGCQGVWGWDTSHEPTPGHEVFGPTRPWWTVLDTPGARQLTYLRQLLDELDWWALRPVADPFADNDALAGLACASRSASTTVVYVENHTCAVLRESALPESRAALWFDPRTGEVEAAAGATADGVVRFDTPTHEDWVLVVGERVAGILSRAAGR